MITAVASPGLSTESAELMRRLGRAPTATELALDLGMDRDEVIDLLVVGGSYRAPHDGDSGSVPACARNTVEWDAQLDCIRDREALRPLLAALPERERTVVVLRFFESLPQTRIAELIGASPVHVSKLLATALTRLRDQLQGSAAAIEVA